RPAREVLRRERHRLERREAPGDALHDRPGLRARAGPEGPDPVRARAPDRAALNIEVRDLERVPLDEVAPRLHLGPHEDREDPLRLSHVIEPDLEELSRLGVHGRVEELLGVHLSETLEPLNGEAGLTDLP